MLVSTKTVSEDRVPVQRAQAAVAVADISTCRNDSGIYSSHEASVRSPSTKTTPTNWVYTRSVISPKKPVTVQNSQP